MRVNSWFVALGLVAATAVLPASAAAEIMLTPFVGVTFGGDAPERRPTVGGGITFVGRSIGLEIEAAQTSNFFGEDTPADVTTLSAALVAGADLPGPGVKPFFLAGVGLIRTNVSATTILDDTSYNNFAILLGGGVNVLFTDHIGLRGDLRYYRRLEKESDLGIIPIASNFDFWRATAGVNFRF